MLKVKQVRKYSIAKYPHGNYHEPPEYLLPEFLKDSALAVTLMLLVESCGTKISGVPYAPEMVTETEARTILNRVLQNNGIARQDDAPLTLNLAGGGSVQLVVDGYNDSLRVGYEYAIGDDYATFTPQVTTALDSLAKAQGPYIEVIDEMDRHEHSNYEQLLETSMQQFLDTLKAHGVI